MREVVLASGSPRRTALLRQIDVPHRVLATHVDEALAADWTPPAAAAALALRKAEAAVEKGVRGWIVAADTVVALGGEILGKPQSAAHARELLARLQGRTHRVYTGVCVFSTETRERRSGVSRAKVRLRTMPAPEIAAYVATGEPLDKAGAYSIQGRGAAFVEWVCGDYYAVVGLPLAVTSRFLSELGYGERADAGIR